MRQGERAFESALFVCFPGKCSGMGRRATRLAPMLQAPVRSARVGAAFLSLFGAALLLSVGCSNVKSSHVPGGGHLITCTNGMKDCVGRAAKLCGDDGYTITRGVSRPKLLGGASSQYRSMSESAELTIVCGELEEEEGAGPYQLPPRSDETSEEAEPAKESAPAEPVCTKGATQRCVGPGACDGGQVCQEDGSGFGPCDCGPSASPAPSGARPGDGVAPAPGAPQVPSAPGMAPQPEPLRK